QGVRYVGREPEGLTLVQMVRLTVGHHGGLAADQMDQVGHVVPVSAMAAESHRGPWHNGGQGGRHGAPPESDWAEIVSCGVPMSDLSASRRHSIVRLA